MTRNDTVLDAALPLVVTRTVTRQVPTFLPLTDVEVTEQNFDDADETVSRRTEPFEIFSPR